MSKDLELPYGWAPRDYQKNLWHYMMAGGKRAVQVWHRRSGKDLTALNWMIYSMFTTPGLYWHVFPTYKQGRKAIWDGFTSPPDAKKYLDFIPEDLVVKTRNDEMTVEVKNILDPSKSGSIYQVIGADKPDSLVGPNPIGIILSEYALQNPKVWQLLRPILAENNGWVIFAYTPRGRNHGFDIFKYGEKNDRWFAERLGADDTWKLDEAGNRRPVITQELLDEERESGMPEEMIEQEYFCSFDAPLVGSYYGDLMDKAHAEDRVSDKVMYEPSLPVHTGWDLGVDDSTAIWLFQIMRSEIRFIDYIESSNEGLPYYFSALQERQREGNWTFGTHLAPHDMKVREMTTGESRWEFARKLGWNFTIVPKLGLAEGIHSVRQLIPKAFFHKKKCAHGVDALKNYTKEWDEVRKVFKDKPLHDWSSHPSDALRYVSLGQRFIKGSLLNKKSLPRQAEGYYDPRRMVGSREQVANTNYDPRGSY